MSGIVGTGASATYATTASPIQVAQFPPAVEEKIKLMRKMKAVVEQQGPELSISASGNRTASGSFNTSSIFEPTGGSQHPAGRIAISVTKTQNGWIGSIQLYPGNGRDPEVLTYQSPRGDLAQGSRTPQEFARYLVRYLSDERIDAFRVTR